MCTFILTLNICTYQWKGQDDLRSNPRTGFMGVLGSQKKKGDYRMSRSDAKDRLSELKWNAFEMSECLRLEHIWSRRSQKHAVYPRPSPVTVTGTAALLQKNWKGGGFFLYIQKKLPSLDFNHLILTRLCYICHILHILSRFEGMIYKAIYQNIFCKILFLIEFWYKRDFRSTREMSKL